MCPVEIWEIFYRKSDEEHHKKWKEKQVQKSKGKLHITDPNWNFMDIINLATTFPTIEDRTTKRPLEQQLQHLRQVISVLIFHLGNFSVVRFLAPIFLLVSPGRAIWEGEAGISKESSRFSFSGTCSSLLVEGCSHRQVLKEKLDSGVEKEEKKVESLYKSCRGKKRQVKILIKFWEYSTYSQEE